MILMPCQQVPIYIFWFDTAVNRYLHRARAPLDIPAADTHRRLVVNTSCDYFAPIAFPDDVIGADRVDQLGNSQRHLWRWPVSWR